VQDQLKMYIGSKFEENTFTGFEFQPSARLLWTPDEKRSVWAAISRAVRTPTRDNFALVNTVSVTGNTTKFQRVEGNTQIESESLMAYEAGYRVQATKRFYWDLAVFYNNYYGLIDPKQIGGSYTTRENIPAPWHYLSVYKFDNISDAQNYGTELACRYTVTDKWHLYGQYTAFGMDRIKVGYIERLNRTYPKAQTYLWSSYNLTQNVDFDLMWRYVDNVKETGGIGIANYNVMDMRLAWRPARYEHLELAVVGQNLGFYTTHKEFRLDTRIHGGNYSEQSGVPRSMYGTISYRY
jgi:iron complex outermembrane recepter protein